MWIPNFYRNLRCRYYHLGVIGSDIFKLSGIAVFCDSTLKGEAAFMQNSVWKCKEREYSYFRLHFLAKFGISDEKLTCFPFFDNFKNVGLTSCQLIFLAVSETSVCKVLK